MNKCCGTCKKWKPKPELSKKGLDLGWCKYIKSLTNKITGCSKHDEARDGEKE